MIYIYDIYIYIYMYVYVRIHILCGYAYTSDSAHQLEQATTSSHVHGVAPAGVFSPLNRAACTFLLSSICSMVMS